MKFLSIILLFLLPSFVFAQNWKSVSQNDTIFFSIPSQNNYLRFVRVDSTKTLGTDSLFYFYPSPRLGNDSTLCIDSLGASWLGKYFVKKSNGDELFFNRWLDTILIKSNASLNSTWIMHTDKQGRKYEATIIVKDTLSIDNATDSIKEIQIKVYFNNIPDTNHIYHNSKLVLSKNHGFINCLEWYIFPYLGNSNYPDQYNLLPSYNNQHLRLDKSFYNQSLQYENIAWKYQSGNYWQRLYTPGNILFSYYTLSAILMQDSITQVHQLSSNFVDYSHSLIRDTILSKMNAPDSILRGERLLRDTMYSFSQDKIKYLQPEFIELIPSGTNFYSNYTSYFLKNSICDKLIIEATFFSTTLSSPCINYLPLIGPINNISMQYWSEFGNIANYCIDPSSPNTYCSSYINNEIIYAKIGACEYGTKFNIHALNIPICYGPNGIYIFPNPANEMLNFKMDHLPSFRKAQIYSLHGALVASCENCTSLNTSHLPNGLYFLELSRACC